MESLVAQYGYLAVLLGTFLEGETVLVLAGFAAHRGYLELPLVIACAFVGTLVGDQLYFYLGRSRGTSYIRARPHWASRFEKVRGLLSRHELLLILTFRFLYGIRTVAPFAIGASGTNPVRFLILNVVGAGVWAVSVGWLGYVFGHTLEVIIDDVKRYEGWVLGIVCLVGGGIWFAHWFRTRKTASAATNNPSE